MNDTLEPDAMVRRGLLRVGWRLAAISVLLGTVTRAVAADAIEIHIDNFKFAPTPLTVPKGATVTWINRDDIPHSIVIQAINFHSPPIDTDQSVSFRFAQPGRYDYACGLHPFMHGQVVVQG
jgi:plastocyanin